MGLTIRKEEKDGKCRVVVEGEVDLYTSPDLRAAILKSLPKAGGALGVDLSGVPYMDSSGVATLVEALKLCADKKGSFGIVAPSESVMKVLQLARLDSVFEVWPSL